LFGNKNIESNSIFDELKSFCYLILHSVLTMLQGLSGCNDTGVDRANFDLIFSGFLVLDDEAVMRKQLHEAREQLVRQR
jgi:hypothetical protein